MLGTNSPSCNYKNYSDTTIIEIEKIVSSEPHFQAKIFEKEIDKSRSPQFNELVRSVVEKFENYIKELKNNFDLPI